MFQQRSPRRRSLPTLIVGLVVGALVALAVGVGLQIGNPFATQTVDHSAPPILLDLRDLADYHAAQGRFEVTIDQEQDVKYLPAALAGERVQFVAVASVDAVVDFSHLGDGAVVFSADRTSATIEVPMATLGEPQFDRSLSHVMNRDRGILNRIGGIFSDSPTSEVTLYDAASKKIADAAVSTDLLATAQANVRSMLTTMLGGLGVTTVDVRFVADPVSVA